MSLASLTIDLIANFGQLTADSGKAAQVIVRDSEKMSRAQNAFLRELEKVGAGSKAVAADVLKIGAATVGLSELARPVVAQLEAIESAARSASATSSASFGALGPVLEQSFVKAKTRADEFADGLQRINDKALAVKRSAIADQSAGKIDESQLSAALKAAEANRKIAIQRLEQANTQQAAEEKIAALTATSAAERVNAAKKITDAQNGLTASYREQLAALRELRDAGSLSPAQFRQAGTELVNKQPVRQEAARDAAAAQVTSNGNAAFLASLEQQANFAGKTRAEILALQAAQRGLGKEAEAAIAKIAAFDAKTGQLGKSAFASRNQLLTLQYTISDVVASAGSGISPLTILLQQGGQVYDAFAGQGGIRAGISAVTGIFTPFRVGALGVAAVLGAIAVAAFKGAEQTKVFNDAIALSGNFAGQTAGGFTALTRSIADSGAVTASSAREFGQALIATGEIGPQVFGQAAEAATLYGQATGKTAKEVAQSFASMTRDVTKWTADNNRQLNLVTLAQFEQIKSLQEQGREAEAQAIVYDALTNRLKTLDSNLGILDRALRATKNGWASFWDAAFDIGRPETIEDRIGKASSTLDALRRRQGSDAANPAFSSRPALRGSENSVATQEANLTELAKKKLRQDDNAFAEADRAATNQAAIAFRTKLDGILAAGKTVAQKNKELAELERGFLASSAAGSPVSSAEQKAARDIIEKRFRQTGRKDREPDQILKAERDQSLKEYENQLQAERAATDFQQKYLQGVYDSGAISLRSFYDKRRAVTEASLAAELSAIEKSIGAEEVFLAKSKDPSDRIAAQTKINDFRDQQTAARIAGARSITLANQQEAASLKALNDRVIEYSAELKQLEGDEAGAAAIRTKQAIENAQLLSRSSGGLVNQSDIARQQKALELANQLAEAQRQIGFITNKAAAQEQLFLLQSQNNALSLYDTERGLTDIRTRAAEQLRIQAEQLREIAAAAPDDQSKQEAATNAMLQYAQAVDQADESLNRLRDAAKSAAGGIAQTIGESIVNFKGLGSVIDSVEKQLLNIGTKVLVTDPLTKGLEGIFKSATEGDNPLGDFFKGALGIGGDAAGSASKAAETAAITANVVATTTSTAALAALAAAAGSAALSLGATGGASALGSITTAGANAASSGGLFSSAASFFSGFFADGGNIPAGKWGVVGENGPEIAFGGSAGKNIVPLKRGSQAAPSESRSSGSTNYITVEVKAQKGVSQDTAMQQGLAYGRGIQMALDRNG